MTGEFGMPACGLVTLTHCFESSFCLSFPRYLLLCLERFTFCVVLQGKIRA